MKPYDIAIIGGGAAGRAAAVAGCTNGLKVCLLDEQPESRTSLLPSGLQYLPSTTVWGLFGANSPDGDGSHRVLFRDPTGLGRLHARYVVLATGSYPLRAPFAGCDLPGVVSAE